MGITIDQKTTKTEDYYATSAVTAGYVVKPSTTFLKCELAAANQKAVGIASNTAATGDKVTVVTSGLTTAIAGDTTAINDWLKADSNGKLVPIATTGTTAQNVVAQALQVGAANGIILVRVIPFVEAAARLTALYTHIESAQCFIPIPLTSWRIVNANDIPNTAANGGVAAKDTDPIFEYTNVDTDSCLRLNWAATSVIPIVAQIPLPPNLDVTADIVLHFRACMSDTNDTPAIDADTYFNEGDTKVEDASAALSDSYAEVTITVGNADVPAGAQTMTIELTPQAHANDIIYMTATWLEFTESVRTS